LENQISSKTQKTWWGRAKTYEADILLEYMVWEVKPFGTDGSTQLALYMKIETF
jgi:hypothetical protein